MHRNNPGLPEPGKNKVAANHTNTHIAASGLYNLPRSFLKRMGGYIHSRLPGVEGTASPHDRDDDIEYWTGKINGMGSGDSIVVCNLNILFSQYIDVGDRS